MRQPDGGRDAFFNRGTQERKEIVVFQVKYSKNPNEKKERDVIDSLIKSEEEKVKLLIQKGATQYYLITNVPGTAHPETGSIDKVNKSLTKRFEIPCFVWWRDDLDRRLDNASDIKWSYPEICRATDVLQFLVKRQGYNYDPEASRAITAYMSKQYGDDKDVKFKQVELKRRITDLFVDIPIDLKGAHLEGKRFQRTYSSNEVINRYLEQLVEKWEFEPEEDHQIYNLRLAAGFLLHMPFGKGVTKTSTRRCSWPRQIHSYSIHLPSKPAETTTFAPLRPRLGKRCTFRSTNSNSISCRSPRLRGMGGRKASVCQSRGGYTS